METIGGRIYYYRRQRGLSRKETAGGICHETTLFRVEKGDLEPGIYIASEICKKLNIPVSYLFKEQDNDVQRSITTLKQRCRKHVYYKEYGKLDDDLKILQGQIKQANIQNKPLNLFITWHQAILLHNHNNDPESAKGLLEGLIPNHPVLEIEIAMMNTLGLIYVSLKDKEKALYYFQTGFTSLKTFPSLDDHTLLIRVGYNYASRLFYLQDYWQIISITSDLLNYLLTHHLYYMRGRIYHLLGITYGKQGDFQEGEKYLDKAITIFNQENNAAYLEISRRDLEIIRTRSVTVENN